MYTNKIIHPSHNPSTKHLGYTFRQNPFTNEWEWWMFVDSCWQRVNINDKDDFTNPYHENNTIVSYIDTWAEPVLVTGV